MRFIKMATLAGLSSVYLLQNGCDILPNVGTVVRAQLRPLLAQFGITI